MERAVYPFEVSGPGRYRGVNPAQRLTLEFNRDEVRLRHPQGDAIVRLMGYGYGNRLRAPRSPQLKASDNRIEYQRGELSEWYVNGSRGLEQGFTFARRPGASQNHEPLVIALRVSGPLRPDLTPEGDSVRLRSAETPVLRYTGLRAWDARGRVLNSKLQVGQREIRLVVDDHDAQYPVVVDPLWTQQAELTASDGASSDEFGQSVAVSGNTAVFGTTNKNSSQGAAYVFVLSGTTWSQQAELTASDRYI